MGCFSHRPRGIRLSLQQKLAYILTLRYDPNGPTTIPKLSWSDFVEYPEMGVAIEPLLHSTLRKIIRNRNRIGMGISGGVDTSTVLALTRHIYPNLTIHTYCVTFGNDMRESKEANHIADIYGTTHETVVIENPFERLEKQVKILGEPRWNLYTEYLVQKASQDKCDLLLTGDAGDELFGGYAFRYDQILKSAMLTPIDYLNAHKNDWVPNQTDLIPQLSWDEIYTYLNLSLTTPLRPLGQVFLADFNGKLLHDFLPTTNAFSRYYKVPVESPFLQPEIIYTASHLPDRLKYDPVNRIGKLLLRSILLQHSGLQVATREKVGWGMDLAWQWDNHIREMCKDKLGKIPFKTLGLNPGWLPAGYEKADEHDLRYICKMLGLLAIGFWLK